jgi:hypothetical protein
MSKLWKYLGAAAALTTLVPLRVDVDKETQEKTFRSLLVKATTYRGPEGGTHVVFDFGLQNPFAPVDEPVPVEVVPMDTPEDAAEAPEPAPETASEAPETPADAPETPSFSDEEAAWYADLPVEEIPAEKQKESEETL